MMTYHVQFLLLVLAGWATCAFYLFIRTGASAIKCW